VIRVTVLAAVVGVAALVWVGTPVPPASARVDAYAVPDPLPPAAPGTIIRSEPLAAPAGTRLWRVLYHSRSLDGRDIAVSGYVAAPAGETRSRRVVVALGHGTTGLADRCAPSRTASDLVGMRDQQDLLRAGYVIAATDYEGLGTPGEHAYLVGPSEGRGMLDAVRAARNLRAAHAGKRVVSVGHSQGGQAAWFAAHEARTYAPELDLIGLVASAPLIDPLDFVARSTSTPELMGYAVMMVRGYEAAYPELDGAALLTPAAASASAIVDEQCANQVEIAFLQPARAVFAHDPVGDPQWAARFRESALPTSGIDAPVLVVKGGDDALLPKPQTDAFVQDACSAGTRIDYLVYPGDDHNQVFFDSRAAVDDWIAARVRGTPARRTCSAAA
jgi:dienelactone hydrolase